MSSTVLVSGLRLMDLRQAFLALANRRLPAVSDARVAFMYASLRPRIEAYTEAMSKLKVRQETAERLEAEDPDRLAEEAEVALEAQRLADALYEIPVPARRLNDADLPLAFKSKDGEGEKNAAGRAAIAATLAPEYFELKNPDAEAVPDLAPDIE